MGRKKSTEDKKKLDIGAPGTLETVSPTVEGSTDNRTQAPGLRLGSPSLRHCLSLKSP